VAPSASLSLDVVLPGRTEEEEALAGAATPETPLESSSVAEAEAFSDFRALFLFLRTVLSRRKVDVNLFSFSTA